MGSVSHCGRRFVFFSSKSGPEPLGGSVCECVLDCWSFLANVHFALYSDVRAQEAREADFRSSIAYLYRYVALIWGALGHITLPLLGDGLALFVSRSLC